MKYSKAVIKKEMIPMAIGSVLTLGGIALIGRGLYMRGRSEQIDEFTSIVFDQGSTTFDLYDSYGKLYCIKGEYLGD